MLNTLNKNRILTDNEMQRVAPSVFAREAWQETSEHYRFLPTIDIINALRDTGYNVTMAGQSRTRIEGKGGFTKHIVRMRHNSALNPENVGEEVPEIVLVNSHDRTSAYKMMLGIFRIVCSNGLIVASETIESLNVRHSGSRDLLQDVIDVSHQVTQQAPKALEQINRFKSIEMTQPEQEAFARSAVELVPSTMDIRPESLIRPRRYADFPKSGISNLWKVSNVVQENIIRGGAIGRTPSGLRRTRAVSCIKNNVDINKALWRLTEEMAKIKA